MAVEMLCSKCKEITGHLRVHKGGVEYWECEKCGCSDIPVLTYPVMGLCSSCGQYSEKLYQVKNSSRWVCGLTCENLIVQEMTNV